MLPPHRLRTLLNQAIELQKEKCPYHNTKNEAGMHTFSLLSDHVCSGYEFVKQLCSFFLLFVNLSPVLNAIFGRINYICPHGRCMLHEGDNPKLIKLVVVDGFLLTLKWG